MEVYLCISPIPDRRLAIQPELRDVGLTRETRGYAPGTNGLPTLFSCGQDKRPGTPDDLRPDLARFEPGTAWTNGWVSADARLPGVTVLPFRSAGETGE